VLVPRSSFIAMAQSTDSATFEPFRTRTQSTNVPEITPIPQLSGDDLVALSKLSAPVRSNASRTTTDSIGVIIAIVIGLLIIVLAVIALLIWFRGRDGSSYWSSSSEGCTMTSSATTAFHGTSMDYEVGGLNNRDRAGLAWWDGVSE
jgi:hypothetical protein